MISLKQSKAPRNPPPDEVVERANDLYWSSGASVNQLTRELDLSKGALYEIITPMAAGLRCPCGGGEMAYTNRTARERGFVSCTTCGLEDEEEHVRDYLDEQDYSSAVELTAADPGLPQVRSDGQTEELNRPPPRNLEKLLVASALAGLAVGLVLGGLLRRR
ncbi:MAG: hypothetical protein F4139_11825 [Gemmatimonadetes bacterium]|nr:hypothetical protein [Gemmatimonadota bacterium]MYH53609.1 hypothetical protein [Gemmatimonadota bacterium]MYK67371.1 hypothetical protein [Gemmatimonadota bacterium]